RAVVSIVPTSTGTRPPTVSTTVRITVARCSESRYATSPVDPSANTPWQPAATSRSVVRASESVSTDPSGWNAVTTGGTTPRSLAADTGMVPSWGGPPAGSPGRPFERSVITAPTGGRDLSDHDVAVLAQRERQSVRRRDRGRRGRAVGECRELGFL